MQIFIYPGFAELIVVVNPPADFQLKEPPTVIMPSLYAPWLDAREKGSVQLTIKGETLRDLLVDITEQFQKANTDFKPIDPKTNDIDFDYDVLVNGKNYVSLPLGLDAKLKDLDEVRIKMMWRWDG
jgi:hypothetical protein